MARVIGVTVWQEGSFCQCQSLVTWTDLSSSHSYSTCIACHKRQEEFFICPCQFRARPAEYMVHVLDQCASIHVTVYDVPAELLQHCLWHSFCVVHNYVCTVCLIFCGQRFLHSDDGHVHATTQFSARALQSM